MIHIILGAIFLIAISFFIILLIFSLSAREKVVKALSLGPNHVAKGTLVSLIIPAFNEEDYLSNCLKSIKNQTYRNIELIVVDNLSTDKTKEVAKDFGAEIITAKEKNLSIVRNKGVEAAKGEILLFIDADCILENRFVEKMVRKLLNSDKAAFSHGGICCYDSIIHNFLWIFNRWFKPYFYTSGRNGACLWKKTFLEIGGYNKNLNPIEGYREDLDLGIRILKRFGFSSVKYCPTVLIGSSARREKVFGYQFWRFPYAWERGIRGVRGKKIVY